MTAKARRVRKRCAKCGAVGLYRPGERKCKQQPFGPRSYCCWGALKRVTRATAVSTVESRGEAHRARYAAKAAAARSQMRRLATKIRGLEARLDKAEQRTARFERLAGLTDEQVEAIRQRALLAGQVQKVRRRLTGHPRTPDEPTRFIGFTSSGQPITRTLGA